LNCGGQGTRDVAADSTPEAQHFDHVLQFADGQVNVLQRTAPGPQPAGAFRHHRRDLVIEIAQGCWA
jgi:hypothetical protein